MEFARKLLQQVQTGCQNISDKLNKEKDGTYTIAADDYQRYRTLKTAVIQNY
jgi:hypothetical protein